MLPTDLLIHHYRGDTIVPQRLSLTPQNLATAAQLIDLFARLQGRPQSELEQQLKELEGDAPDYRLKRGLAHLLRADCQFEIRSPLEPVQLRQQVFAAAANRPPSPVATQQTLARLAAELSQTQGREIGVFEIQAGLYADLAENHILISSSALTPEALLHRYNLAQVQGVLYRAGQVVLQVHRNDPGEYKLLFRYLKLFQLMAYVEGDADYGFTITIDGPTSLFKPSTRYGIDLAKLLPALLHVTRWGLTATLHHPDRTGDRLKTLQFTLDHHCDLVSHYPPGKPFDSMIEQSFAHRWQAMQTDWRLEREVELLPIPGSVMIPDFRLVHPSGQSVLLEIIGYWRPEYLRKKFAQVRKSDCPALILAISERLNLEKAGVQAREIPVPIVWFKRELLPKAVLAVLETHPFPRSFSSG